MSVIFHSYMYVCIYIVYVCRWNKGKKTVYLPIIAVVVWRKKYYTFVPSRENEKFIYHVHVAVALKYIFNCQIFHFNNTQLNIKKAMCMHK